MKNSLNPLYSTPAAVLLGAVIIAVSVLMHGGIIKVGKRTTTSSQPTAAQPAQLQAAKTEADIIKSLKAQASSLKLDQSKFNKCLDSGEKANLVSADLDEGSKAGVNGTPAFFVNGHGISGAQPITVFKDAIDFILGRGDWSKPNDKVKYLVDGNPQNGEIDENKVQVANGNLPALGSNNSPITLIEFSDYQCPFCARHFTQTEPQLKKDYIDTGKVVFYYRDFPLSQIHPGAQKAAEAARCAGDQGKYWEYHDAVFQNQTSIF